MIPCKFYTSINIPQTLIQYRNPLLKVNQSLTITSPSLLHLEQCGAIKSLSSTKKACGVHIPV